MVSASSSVSCSQATGALSYGRAGGGSPRSPEDNGDTLIRGRKLWKGKGTQVGVYFGKDLWSRDPDGLFDWAKIAAAHAGGETYAGPTSPHWYDDASFYALPRFARGPHREEADSEQFEGCTGAKAGKIASAFKQRDARLLTQVEAACLLAARENALRGQALASAPSASAPASTGTR